MVFNFRLAPLEQLVTWGSEPDLHLHWFGLTYGCYWLSVGESELFRYRGESGVGDQMCGSYVDYQVVRLWEDVLAMLPHVLTPVPADLGRRLAPLDLLAWWDRMEHWVASTGRGLTDPSYQTATEWVRQRFLFSEHLAAAPASWAWSDGVDVHIAWDNRGCLIDGQPVWTAEIGRWPLPVEDFLREVRTFDAAFIQAMERRIGEVIAGGRPGVRIDGKRLLQEQADRSTWLESALGRRDRADAVDWSAIAHAIATIEAENAL